MMVRKDFGRRFVAIGGQVLVSEGWGRLTVKMGGMRLIGQWKVADLTVFVVVTDGIEKWQ